MSFILSKWLETDVHLPLPGGEKNTLENVFSSGYYFGKVLFSLGLQDDFETAFVKGSTVDAVIKNYTCLEATLRSKLHVKLSPGMALDLIHEKVGSVAKLLYEIKTAAEAIPSKTSSKAASVALKSTKKYTAFDSYPSSPVGGQSAESILAKEFPQQVLPYEAQAIQHFATVLKQKLKRTNEFIPKSAIQKKSIVAKKKELPPIPKITPQSAPNSSPSPPSSARQKRIQPVYATAAEVDSDSDLEDVKPTTINKNPIVPMIPPVFDKVSKKGPQKQDSDDDYESTNTNSLSLDQVSDFLHNRAHLDSTKHMRTLRRVMDDPQVLNPAETKFYLEKIKVQRHEVETARKERDQKRKEILLIQQKTEEEVEKKIMDDILMNKLLRQSKQERRIAEQLLAIRHEKEVMLEHRLFREEQYKIMRQKEYEEALQREHELYKTAENEYRHQVGMQIEQHLEIIQAKKLAQHEKDTEWVKDKLTLEIVNLAMKSVEYKILHDKKEIPAKKLKELKQIMLNNLSIDDYEELSLEKNVISTPGFQRAFVSAATSNESKISIPGYVAVLDTDDFNDYLSFQGPWESGAEGLIKNHDNLAHLVETLIISTKPAEEKYPSTPIPSVPLRMALIGKRYSGKSSVAKFLAKKYNLAILEVDDLVKDAINQVDSQKKKTPDQQKKVAAPVKTTQTGQKVQMSMLEGQAPDDAFVVQLIIDAIREEPAEHTGGWLIVDFPKTKAQAQLLEHELTGYEDPKPAKKGEMKRPTKANPETLTANPKVSVPLGGRNRSLIASVENPLDAQNSAPVSGLDAVFLLDITNETSIKRGSGLSIDPVTGFTYHIEYSPPPVNSPGTLERLAPLEDASRSAQVLQFQLAAFEEEEEGIKEWWNQFKNLQTIDANGDAQFTEQVIETGMNELVKLINKQRNEIKLSSNEGNHGGDTGSEEERETRPNSGKLLGIPQHPDSPRKLERRASSVIAPILPVQQTETEVLPPLPVQETKKGSISKEMGQILVDNWALLETTYTETLKFSFRSLRRLNQDSVYYFYDTKVKFENFLKRPDIEQELIETFQKEYNTLEEDFRADPEVKAELHMRVEELRERLWEVIDRRRDEAEAERIAIIEDRWVEDHSYILANLTVSMIQAEADRFFATRQFLIDYFKELNGLVISETVKAPVKIPFISLNANPPIEIVNGLIAASEAVASHRKDQATKSAPDHVPHKKEKGEKTEKESKNEKTKEKASQKKDGKAVENKAPPTPVQIEKENTIADPDSFPDIGFAIEFLYNVLASPEYSLEPPAPEGVAPPGKKGAVEVKDDTEKAIPPPEAIKFLETEEKMLRQRVERLRQKLVEVFKDLKYRALEVYSMLDEWIGARYKLEIDATKDLTTLIKEAIEAEQRLPNRILLQGEKLFLDFGTLVLEPEPEPRPESPIEKQPTDQFSVAQLRILSSNLKQLAPTGIISSKCMIDYFSKASIFAGATDGLPEHLVGSDSQVWASTISSLDPFDTGFLNWRKFWMANSKLLPLDLDQIIDLKALFQDKLAITRSAYQKLEFWYEKGNAPLPGQFDRVSKLKQAIYEVFTSTNPDDFDKLDFLLICCSDEDATKALEKAFTLMIDPTSGSQTISKQQVMTIFSHFLNLTKSTHRIDTTIDAENPYPEVTLNKIFAAAGVSERITFSQFVDGCKKSDNVEWLECPLYLLDESGSNSRPSSGGKPKGSVNDQPVQNSK